MPQSQVWPADDSSTLEQELATLRRTVRDLQRQASKDQARYVELSRAYGLTVANLVKTTSECNAMERERDEWRQRAEEQPTTATFADGSLIVTADEVKAIRKAIARLHHPDHGGDTRRMQAWNALLDLLERGNA